MIIMKTKKNYNLVSLFLTTALIVFFAGIAVVPPALSISGPFVPASVNEGKGCLSYQTFPSQVHCAVSIVQGGLLKV
jgi:hypothetical protein